MCDSEVKEPSTETPALSVKDVYMENTMHDKCKSVIVFHNNLSKFFKALKGVLPEYVGTIRSCISYYKSVSRVTYLQEVQTLLDPHIKHISQYDNGIFTDDYSVGPRYLLPKMDFREIWLLLDKEDEEFEDDVTFRTKTKKTIFNHIQSIYVSVHMALNQITVFNKNIEKQKTFLMEMLENLQLDDTIKARIEEMKAEEMKAEEAKTNKSSGGFSLDKLGDMFGQDNFVFQLAKDVAEELEIGGDNIENPVEAITALFADNGRKLQDLIVAVGDKIEQKVQSGAIDKNKLLADAKTMKDKLEGFMGKIPGLEDMVNNNGMVNQLADMYDKLAINEQERYSYVPALLQRDFLKWTEEEKTQFDEYAKYVLDKERTHTEASTNSEQNVAEDNMDIEKIPQRLQRNKKRTKKRGIRTSVRISKKN